MPDLLMVGHSYFPVLICSLICRFIFEVELRVLSGYLSNIVGRYAAVNLCNYSTIEFRLFRGTLKINTFIATLQLVNEICNVAVSMSDESLQKLS